MTVFDMTPSETDRQSKDEMIRACEKSSAVSKLVFSRQMDEY